MDFIIKGMQGFASEFVQGSASWQTFSKSKFFLCEDIVKV